MRNSPSAGLSPRAFAIIFGVSLTTAVGNPVLVSVLPAIDHSIGILDAMVVAIFSFSALMWTITSPFWARASARLGRALGRANARWLPHSDARPSRPRDIRRRSGRAPAAKHAERGGC